MTVTITAAAGNVNFKDHVFAYSCILALIIDACNYCKYIGNGSTLYMVTKTFCHSAHSNSIYRNLYIFSFGKVMEIVSFVRNAT